MHRLTFDLLLHIAGVGGMGGSPSIILVVTVTGWGVDLSFTNIFHQQLITFIGTFFVADVFINLDPSISFDDVFFFVSPASHPKCATIPPVGFKSTNSSEGVGFC